MQIITKLIANLAVTTAKIANLAITDAKVAAGIDAAKIADGTVSNAEFQFINSLTSNAQTQIDSKVAKAGDTMSGNLALGGNKVTGLGAPTVNGDALRYDQLGANNGIATLDGGGKVPVAQLPNSIMEFQGQWNASTNSPALIDGTGNTGDVYRVNTAGSQDLGSGSVSYIVGDWVMYNGTIWQKATNAPNYAVGKEALALDATDITNQYVDLAEEIVPNSLDLHLSGVLQREGVDYTLSTVSSVTRITFAGDLATGGNAELINGDTLYAKYQY